MALGTIASMAGCDSLLFTADRIYDLNAYGWWYDGVQPPYYGAFAEQYDAAGELCDAVFDFTQTGNAHGALMDVYVWADDGNVPGEVLYLVTDVDPGPIAWYPDFSRHTAPLWGAEVSGLWWVGFWGNWPGEIGDWFIAADGDGPRPGRPSTNVAPGIGYPTGWQNVSVAWGATQALGIGATIRPSEPTPVNRTTWGGVKALFR